MSIPAELRGVIRPTDKIICSFPRSGNTWLRFLVTRAAAFGKTASPGDVPIRLIVPDLHSELDYLDAPEQQALLGGFRILKCHEPDWVAGNPMAYIFRRPADVLTSLFFHAQTFPEQREPVRKEGIDAFALARREKWESNVQIVLDNVDRGNILLLSYERLLEHTETCLEDALRFFGLYPGHEAIAYAVRASAFDELKKRNNPKRPMFRAGTAGDSANHLKPETIYEINETSGRLYEALCAAMDRQEKPHDSPPCA